MKLLSELKLSKLERQAVDEALLELMDDFEVIEQWLYKELRKK